MCSHNVKNNRNSCVKEETDLLLLNTIETLLFKVWAIIFVLCKMSMCYLPTFDYIFSIKKDEQLASRHAVRHLKKYSISHID